MTTTAEQFAIPTTTRPMVMHTDDPTARPSSEDATILFPSSESGGDSFSCYTVDTSIPPGDGLTNSVLWTASSDESAKATLVASKDIPVTTSITSKGTAMSECGVASLSPASMPPSSITALGASSAFVSTFYSTSSSILADLCLARRQQ